jgi:hypothetical protein
VEKHHQAAEALTVPLVPRPWELSDVVDDPSRRLYQRSMLVTSGVDVVSEELYFFPKKPTFWDG